MKIDEVMLGDIVSAGGRPIHVTLAVLNNWSDNIKPIPLTKELLEKNGFVEIELVSVGGCKRKSIVREGIEVAIDFVHQEFWIVHVGKLFYEAHMMIYYLHELQHLLTLCKIDFDWKV